MYGQRARFGCVAPSPNTSLDFESAQLLPSDVTMHITRVKFPDSNSVEEKERALAAMALQYDHAFEILSDIKPTAISLACTSASFNWGFKKDKVFISKLASKFEVSVTTTAMAIVEALRHLKIDSVATVSPYDESVDLKQKNYLNQAGISVSAQGGPVIFSAYDKGGQTLAEVKTAVLEADLAGAKAVLVACTNWPSMGILQDLEEELGIPVLSSNSANLWHLMRLSGVSDSIPGFGRLFVS